MINRCARGHLGRRLVKGIREGIRKEMDATLLIQSVLRGRIARRRAKAGHGSIDSLPPQVQPPPQLDTVSKASLTTTNVGRYTPRDGIPHVFTIVKCLLT